MFIKAYLKGEVHLISLKSIPNINMLHSLLKTLFKNLPKSYTLLAEISNNKVKINSDEDISNLKESGENFIKVMIHEGGSLNLDQTQLLDEEGDIDSNEKISQKKQSQTDRKNTKVLNNQNEILSDKESEREKLLFHCMICESIYNNSVMYRCSVCPDLDICQNCQAIFEHSHPMIKIKNNEQRNIKIFAVIADEMADRMADEIADEMANNIKEWLKSKTVQKQVQNKKEESKIGIEKLKTGLVNTIVDVGQRPFRFFTNWYKKDGNKKEQEDNKQEFKCKVSEIKKSQKQEINCSDDEQIKELSQSIKIPTNLSTNPQ